MKDKEVVSERNRVKSISFDNNRNKKSSQLKTPRKLEFVKKSIELQELKINPSNQNTGVNRLTDFNDILTQKNEIKKEEEISSETFLKIIYLQREEIKLLQERNSILLKTIEKFNASENHKTSLISQTYESPEEIIKNDERSNFNEFKIDLNLNILSKQRVLDLPDLRLTIEGKSNELFFKDNQFKINNKELTFIELHGKLEKIDNHNLLDFSINIENFSDGIDRILNFLLILKNF